MIHIFYFLFFYGSWFSGFFSTFYGRHSVTAAWANPSPWSIINKIRQAYKVSHGDSNPSTVNFNHLSKVTLETFQLIKEDGNIGQRRASACVEKQGWSEGRKKKKEGEACFKGYPLWGLTQNSIRALQVPGGGGWAWKPKYLDLFDMSFCCSL